MNVHSINNISLELECDRSTLVRALRDVEPDIGAGTNRPQYKILTAVRALAEHRAKSQRADGRERFSGFKNGGTHTADNWKDPLLVELFKQEDQALEHMRSQPTLDGRRKAARAMVPLISKIHRAVCERGVINGFDSELTYYRAQDIYRVGLRNFEEPCEWDELTTRDEMTMVEA